MKIKIAPSVRESVILVRVVCWGLFSESDYERKCPVVAKRLDCGDFSPAVGARRDAWWFVGFRPPESAAQADAVQTLRDFWERPFISHMRPGRIYPARPDFEKFQALTQ